MQADTLKIVALFDGAQLHSGLNQTMSQMGALERKALTTSQAMSTATGVSATAYTALGSSIGVASAAGASAGGVWAKNTHGLWELRGAGVGASKGIDEVSGGFDNIMGKTGPLIGQLQKLWPVLGAGVGIGLATELWRVSDELARLHEQYDLSFTAFDRLGQKSRQHWHL